MKKHTPKNTVKLETIPRNRMEAEMRAILERPDAPRAAQDFYDALRGLDAPEDIPIELDEYGTQVYRELVAKYLSSPA